MIPLNQLIPECLLALGGAFLLGNLAAYIRLRPAWRDAKHARAGQANAGQANAGQVNGGQAVKRGARATAKSDRTGSGTAKPGPTGAESTKREQGRSGGAKAAAKPKPAGSSRVSARVREPTGAGSRLPSRTRVLVNVLIGLVITAAALATLIRA